MSKNNGQTTPRARAAVRRETIHHLLSQGHAPAAVCDALMERPDLTEGLARRSVRDEIAKVRREREADPHATAVADHLRGLRRAVAEAEAGLPDAQGTERRLLIAEIKDLRRDLARLEGLDYSPPLGRPAGQRRGKAGQARSKAGALTAPARDPDAADDAPWRREGRPATAAEALAYDPLPPEPDEDPEGYRRWQDGVLNDGAPFEPDEAFEREHGIDWDEHPVSTAMNPVRADCGHLLAPGERGTGSTTCDHTGDWQPEPQPAPS